MDAYNEIFEAQLDRLRDAIKSGSHYVINEILGEEKFRTTLKWKDSHSGENRAKLINIAVCKNDAATMNLLLDHEVTINIDEKRSKVIPPLVYAVIHGRERIAEILASRVKEHVDQRTAGEEYYQLYNGDTALHAASRYGSDRLAVMLLKNGANIDAENSKSETALHVTIKAKLRNEVRLVMARCLLDHGARIDIGRKPALLYAIRHKQLDIARLIIDQRKDALEIKDCDESGAIHYALSEFPPNIEFVKLLIEKGIRVDESNMAGETPLHLAVSSRDIAMTKLLLQYDVDVDARMATYETPLYTASLQDNFPMVKLLLAAGAHVNMSSVQEQTALHAACEIGSMEIVNELIKHGANVNDSSMYARTPLHVACDKGYKDVVKKLLKLGANPNVATTLFKETPLDIACNRGCKHMVWMLLKFGAEIKMPRFSLALVKPANKKIKEILIKHAFLAEDQLMCEQFYHRYKNDPYFAKCQKELERMKITEFYNGLTFFRILLMQDKELLKLIRNVELRKAFEANYEELFPMYARHMKYKFAKVKQMLEVRNSVEDILNSIFSTVLPSDIIIKVVDYVSHQDLKFLINSCMDSVNVS